MDEIPLQYGNVSSAVRVGDSVHRSTGDWTPTIHALLAYLNDNNFTEAPRVLGFDERGREVLSFLPGIAASRPWPKIMLDKVGVEQAGRLLRKYHDVVVNFVPPADAEWRVGKTEKKPGQIIRHGDLGPWNTIWQNDKLTGLIDWDFAQPGERLEDLAQMAYYFIPLRSEEGWREAGFKERPDFVKRLNTLVSAYGMYSVNELIEAVLVQQSEERKLVREKAAQGIEPWVYFFARGDVEESLRDTKWLGGIKECL